jgi:glycosyltransferase involved in cell wall biosynthesis
MKILFIASGNAIDGIGNVVRNQGVSLEKEGIIIDYFTIKGKGLRGYLKNIRPLVVQLRKNKYDLIHAHYSLSALIPLLTFKSIPIVVSFMGDDILGSQNSKGQYTIKGKIVVFLSKYVVSRFSSSNIVKTVEMQRLLSNSLVTPNGVDFNKFKDILKLDSLNKLGLDINNVYILFPANPKRQEKNYNLAKTAVEKLKKNNIVLLNYNDTPNEMTPYYYNASSVVLLTSFHEGSPNVIKEAMACNIPIVSTDVGDVSKVIENTVGCYIASFDSEDVATKLKKAIGFGKKTSGREDIIHLEEGVISQKIINIYKEILKK